MLLFYGYLLFIYWLFLPSLNAFLNNSIPFPFYNQSKFDLQYKRLDLEEIRIAREQAREMFYFGYENYLKHAFPMDELDPIHCVGRGHDHNNP